MGRPAKQFDESVFFDLLSRGTTQKDMAEELGMSIPTMERKIAEISEAKGTIVRYRELQNLQLTSIQARVLEAITPEKIEGASLYELVQAFRILKNAELVDTGKPTEIRGLVGYLVEMERQELDGLRKGTALTETVQEDITDSSVVEAEYIPNI